MRSPTDHLTRLLIYSKHKVVVVEEGDLETQMGLHSCLSLVSVCIPVKDGFALQLQYQVATLVLEHWALTMESNLIVTCALNMKMVVMKLKILLLHAKILLSCRNKRWMIESRNLSAVQRRQI